jgi:putative oxidoreductase
MINTILGKSDRLIDRHGVMLGRILIGLLFVVTGVFSLTNLSQTTSMIATTPLPFASLLAIVVVIMKLGGGISLIVGKYVRLGSLTLILFTALATAFFHLDPFDMIVTLKNVAIIGGLLAVYRAAPRERVEVAGTVV